LSNAKTLGASISEVEGRLVLGFFLLLGVLILLGLGKINPDQALSFLTAGVAIIATVFKKEPTPSG